MFKGTVTFRARIKGHGLTVSLCAFNPSEPGVETVEIEGRKGDELLTSVHLASVATREDGRAVAMNEYRCPGPNLLSLQQRNRGRASHRRPLLCPEPSTR